MARRRGRTLIWIILGMVLMAAIILGAMPMLMVKTYRSDRGYDATIAALRQAIEAQQYWRVTNVNDFQESIRQGGFGEMVRVGSLSVCNPRYAAAILAEAPNRIVTAMMPLSIGVYEAADGEVQISRVNVELVGMLFGGTIAEVMAEAGEDVDDAIAMVAGDS